MEGGEPAFAKAPAFAMLRRGRPARQGGRGREAKHVWLGRSVCRRQGYGATGRAAFAELLVVRAEEVDHRSKKKLGVNRRGRDDSAFAHATADQGDRDR